MDCWVARELDALSSPPQLRVRSRAQIPSVAFACSSTKPLNFMTSADGDHLTAGGVFPRRELKEVNSGSDPRPLEVASIPRGCVRTTR